MTTINFRGTLNIFGEMNGLFHSWVKQRSYPSLARNASLNRLFLKILFGK